MKAADEIPELERLRVALLYKQSATTQFAGVLNAIIYAAMSIGLVPSTSLIFWGCLVLGVFAARMAGQNWFNTTFIIPGKVFDTKKWEGLFAFGTLTSGLCWAVVGTIMLPAESVAHQTFLAFLLAGTTAGAAVAYCTSLRALLAFLLAALLPFAIHLIVQGGSTRYAMATLLGLYIIVLTVSMMKMNKYVVDSIRLRFEKDHLLTELRETQDKITHSAKMAALGVMAGGVAHEINNPLAAIRMECASLRDEAAKSNPKLNSLLSIANTIDATVSRISKIVLSLAAFAREGIADARETVPVDGIVLETLAFCQARFENQGVILSVNTIAPKLMLNCRRTQIGQVLLSLLNNAFDAVQGQPGAWVKVSAVEHASHILLSVTDNGPGIAPENIDKIMQPFFTTKEVGKGTGLGLSASHGILTSHGGTLSLDRSSKQTCFVITLPIAEPLLNAATA